MFTGNIAASMAVLRATQESRRLEEERLRRERSRTLAGPAGEAGSAPAANGQEWASQESQGQGSAGLASLGNLFGGAGAAFGSAAARTLGALTGPTETPEGRARRPFPATELEGAIDKLGLAAIAALLGAGADPNGRCSNGASPLERCLRRGDVRGAEMLIAAGADEGARALDGRSMADLAREAASRGPGEGKSHKAMADLAARLSGDGPEADALARSIAEAEDKALAAARAGAQRRQAERDMLNHGDEPESRAGAKPPLSPEAERFKRELDEMRARHEAQNARTRAILDAAWAKAAAPRGLSGQPAVDAVAARLSARFEAIRQARQAEGPELGPKLDAPGGPEARSLSKIFPGRGDAEPEPREGGPREGLQDGGAEPELPVVPQPRKSRF